MRAVDLIDRERERERESGGHMGNVYSDIEMDRWKMTRMKG